ncbi:DUF3541 domain-containing protein [Vibrio chagasii]|nr:DUF3541 domain-containing protein [Vibrio chagasii]
MKTWSESRWAAQRIKFYWLRQLGEQDVVDEFVDTFKSVSRRPRTRSFPSQQYGNKIWRGTCHLW